MSALRCARALALFAAIGSTWTSVTIRGQALSDLVLLPAGGLAFVGVLDRRIAPRLRVHRSLVACWSAAFWCLSIAICFTLARANSVSAEAAGALGFLGAIFLVPALIALVASGERSARALLIALVASGAINGAVALLDSRFGTAFGPARLSWNEYEPNAQSRAVGLTGHPNILGFVAATVIPLVPPLILTSPGRARKLALGLAGSLILVGLALSGSRGGALGALAGVLFLATRSAPLVGGRALRRAILLTMAGLPLLTMLAPRSSLAVRLMGGEDASASNESRLSGLSAALRGAREAFPAGTGFAEIYSVHSGVLAILVAGGVLALLGAAIWCVGLWRVMAITSKAGSASVRVLGFGCQASGVGALAFLATSPIIYHRYALIPAGVGIALATMTGGARSPASSAGLKNVSRLARIE